MSDFAEKITLEKIIQSVILVRYSEKLFMPLIVKRLLEFKSYLVVKYCTSTIRCA